MATLTAYDIIGRTDGIGGKSGVLELSEADTARICDEMGKCRFTNKPLRLVRLGGLELQGEGWWLEGWTRLGLYKLLGLEPWVEGATSPVEQPSV